MTNGVQDEIDRATRLGQGLEDLVVGRAKAGALVVRTKNDDLLIAYWSLIFEYSKGILCLARYEFYSPAAALLRPLVEALVRAHIVKIGLEDDVDRIRKGRYKVNYDKDGARIDKAFSLGSLFDSFLKRVRNVLHSFTHSGNAQLWRRWSGNEVGANFSDQDITALIGHSNMAVFLMTVLIANHYGLDAEKKTAEMLLLASREAPTL
jgi:hypothetical protein